MISRVSENSADFIGMTPADLIGRPLRECIPAEAVHDLRNRMAMLRGPTRRAHVRLQSSSKAGCFDVALHISGGQIVSRRAGVGEHGDATGMVRAMITRLDQAPDFAAFYAKAPARSAR
jgi:light-regulated signal transduction histidine kinase (bacteriophytochrome)